MALLACRASPVLAQALSVGLRSRTVQPGEAILVTVTAPPHTASVSIAAFAMKWPAYKVDETTWRALIGIDLERRPGSYVLSVDASGATAAVVRRDLTVLPRALPHTHPRGRT